MNKKKHNFVYNQHLFIGGPMDGELQEIDLQECDYLTVEQMTNNGRLHHIYENMGYALVHRCVRSQAEST